MFELKKKLVEFCEQGPLCFWRRNMAPDIIWSSSRKWVAMWSASRSWSENIFRKWPSIRTSERNWPICCLVTNRICSSTSLRNWNATGKLWAFPATALRSQPWKRCSSVLVSEFRPCTTLTELTTTTRTLPNTRWTCRLKIYCKTRLTAICVTAAVASSSSSCGPCWTRNSSTRSAIGFYSPHSCSSPSSSWPFVS